MYFNTEVVRADKIDELEYQMAENDKAIEERRQLLSELSLKSENAKEYISVLSEKMDLQKDKIDIITRQIEQLESDIAVKEIEINELEIRIEHKKSQIDEGVETFKERLRSMYVSGNDSVASILTGASDFYDLLARYELITRVAENDDELITGLNGQLEEYDAECVELIEKRNELNRQKDESIAKLDILQGEMNSMIDEYYDTKYSLDDIMSDSMIAESDIEWLNNANSKIESEIEGIKVLEKKASEKARDAAAERRKEQEKKKADAEQRRVQADRKKQQEREQTPVQQAEPEEIYNNDYSENNEYDNSDSYEEYVPEADVYEEEYNYGTEDYGYTEEDEYDYSYDYDYDTDYYDEYNNYYDNGEYDSTDNYEEYFEDYDDTFYADVFEENYEESHPYIDTTSEEYTGERNDIVDYAKTYLGVYYQWCGNYPAEGYYGLDCSHFTYRVLEHYGLMDSYMDSRGQSSYCTPISEDELLPGDLVFYSSGGRVEHVTMYIGNGQVIGAQGGDSWVNSESTAESINAKVKIVSLYCDNRYMTFGRVPGMY